MASAPQATVEPTSDRVKIALVIPTLDQGGAEKQLVLLAKGLNQDRFEPHVVVLTRTGPYEEELRKAGIPVHVIGKRWKVDPFAFWKLRSLLGKLQPKIVHTWLFAANAYGRWAAFQNRVPVVIGGERCVDPWKSPSQLILDRWLSRRTQAIATNSPAVAEFYGARGIAASKLVVIPNGVELPSGRREVSREEVARRLNIDPRGTWIASVGRLWPQKGYMDLFWAMELVRVARPNVQYVVMGDGPLRERLEEYRDQILAAENIRIVGHRDDVAELLPHFQMVINGSLYEGQSNVLLEAMANEIPVIATDIPGNRDWIKTDETGILVPVRDPHQMASQIVRLLEEPEVARRLAEAGRAQIEREYSVSAMIHAYESLYLDWLNRRS